MSLYLYFLFLSICFCIGLSCYSRLTTSLKNMFWLVVLTILVESVGFYYLRVLNRVAGWVFHVFQPFEYFLVSSYFYNIISTDRIRRIIRITIPIILIANILNFSLLQGPYQLSTYTFLLSAFLFCVWCIVYYIQLFHSLEEDPFDSNPHFWITTGVLFFYAGTFFQMGFTNIIDDKNVELAQKLYIINHLLNCVLFGMLSYGFICQVRFRRS